MNQGLVARRTALRQAESLKGHGYTVGKSIVGRDIKRLKEIDQRKIGRDPETDRYNEELQVLFNKEIKELDNFIISYSAKDLETAPVKPVAKPEPKPMPKKEAVPAEPVPVIQSKPTQVIKSEIPLAATEYDNKSKELPIVKSEPKVEEKSTLMPKPSSPTKLPLNVNIQAKIAFVLIGILDHYNDIWISKKENGIYAVEHMDGKVCEFTISEGKIKFTANSFAGIATNVKAEIQRKFVELSKLL
jgi:hypothetical protein